MSEHAHEAAPVVEDEVVFGADGARIDPSTAGGTDEPDAEPEVPADEAPAEEQTPDRAARAYDIALARLPNLAADIEPAFHLPPGSVHLRGLALTDTEMEFGDWTGILHNIGEFNEWSRFALGDALVFGEALFGEDSSQAVEGTASELYDVAARITGLKPQTVENYASVARRVPLDVRRVELPFGMHEAVRALDREDQIRYLGLAVENSWDREQLRAAIKGEMTPAAEPGEQTVVEKPLTVAQRALEVLTLVAAEGQPTSDGGAVIPATVWAQVRAAVGDE